jgi:D-sedoheptulose 7-phosphate isomerase
MTYTTQHLGEALAILQRIDQDAVERMAALLADLRRRGGRLFILGVGGGAAHATHAPTDNVSELTARTNDEGWPTVFVEWLKTSRLKPDDMIFVISVGGGNLEKNVSPNLVRALQYGREVGARIIGVVGRDGGYTAQVADACVIVPIVNTETVTPHTEAFQAVIWHLLVSHPLVQTAAAKWESVR